MRKLFVLSIMIIYFIPMDTYSICKNCNIDCYSIDEKNEDLKILEYKKQFSNLTNDKLLQIVGNEDLSYYEIVAAIYLLDKRGDPNILIESAKQKDLMEGIRSKIPDCENYEVSIITTTLNVTIFRLEMKSKGINNLVDYCASVIKTYHNENGGNKLSNQCVSYWIRKNQDDKEILELLKYINDPFMNYYLRRITISAIVNNPTPKARDFLEYVITKDENWGNRYWAIVAIEKLGDKNFISKLKIVLENKNEHEKVRKAAEKAIEVLSK
jgi:bifunctional DNA-binding transcriptional regulator/antitoxin component of YhaV-PrlF toxin-antitoxin module